MRLQVQTALHDALKNGPQLRNMRGTGFERLARMQGAVVVYPTGVEGHLVASPSLVLATGVRCYRPPTAPAGLPSVPVWPQRQQPTATPFPQMLGEAWSLIPLEIDLPNHAKRRVLLNPLFAPLRVRRELCIANELWLATLPGRGIKCGGWVAAPGAAQS